MENPDVEKTMHVEPAAGDMTVRPASMDQMDPSGSMDMTMRSTTNPVQDDTDMQDVAGDYFVLKGVKYKNKQCLSENSGEAQVYLVERDGEEYVLKIYYPTFNVNKKMLQAIYNFKFKMKNSRLASAVNRPGILALFKIKSIACVHKKLSQNIPILNKGFVFGIELYTVFYCLKLIAKIGFFFVSL